MYFPELDIPGEVTSYVLHRLEHPRNFGDRIRQIKVFVELTEINFLLIYIQSNKIHKMFQRVSFIQHLC